MYKIVSKPRAEQDLLNAYEYIFYNLSNPIAARNFISQIIKSISYLQYFPFMGAKFYNSNYRHIIFKNYIIFYSVKSNYIEIYRVFHKKQNYNKFTK